MQLGEQSKLNKVNYVLWASQLVDVLKQRQNGKKISYRGSEGILYSWFNKQEDNESLWRGEKFHETYLNKGTRLIHISFIEREIAWITWT